MDNGVGGFRSFDNFKDALKFARQVASIGIEWQIRSGFVTSPDHKILAESKGYK